MSGTSPVPPRGFQPLAIPVSVPPAVPERKRARVGFNVEDKPEPEPAPEAKPEPEEDEDLDKKREEKRRRREAIMAKFRAGEGAKPPLPAGLAPDGTQIDSGAQSVASNDPPTGVNTETGMCTCRICTRSRAYREGTTGTRSVTAAPTPIGNSPSLANTPLGKDFDLEKHGEASGTAPAPGDDVAAGDYDSAVDREKLKDKPSTKPADAEDEWQEVEIEVEDEADEMDMFAAFGDEPAEKKTRKITVRRRKNAAGEVIIEKPKSHKESVLEVVDNVDDVEGYYRITPGELLDDGRYQVTVTLGKGMFSAVVKAKVLKAVGQERRQDVVGKEVAIKLMRSQESMYVAGRKEAQVLKLLNDADPEDRKHIVRMERTFEHKGHFAIVTESMSMNLRDVIKRFGKDVGLNMRAVRAYAHQMLLALSLIRKCNIVHADIKPDNVLVSENKAVLKVCDLGTAAEVSEGEITPYLVSRFYRAPEISEFYEIDYG
jgi:serine/threonine-protein kinase PRP4